jgi:hypothetical protein
MSSENEISLGQEIWRELQCIRVVQININEAGRRFTQHNADVGAGHEMIRQLLLRETQFLPS